MHPANVDGQFFLNGCMSRPSTLAELKVGDKFIYFPYDGDDSGHGGFRGGAVLKEKIEPYHPGKGYHESFRYVCKDYATKDIESGRLNAYVIRIVGIQ